MKNMQIILTDTIQFLHMDTGNPRDKYSYTETHAFIKSMLLYYDVPGYQYVENRQSWNSAAPSTQEITKLE